jgi:phage-related protein
LKKLVFIGGSQDDVRELPMAARHEIGVELMIVQFGGVPTDFKPMISIGVGVYELRVHIGGAFRAVYVSKLPEAVYVLHVFEKKTQKTARIDLELATHRYRLMLRNRHASTR